MSDKKFCCSDMESQINSGLIEYIDRLDEYSIVVREDDGVVVRQVIKFCPWSGHQLPESMRDKWLDELDAMGIDPLNDPIPEKYMDARWRQE